MKSFKTEIYTLDVVRLSAIYGEQLKYATIEDDCILNMDGDICYRNGDKARVLEINGDDYILESEGKFLLTKEELVASQIRNLENGMKRTIKSAEDRYAPRRIGTSEHKKMYGDSFGAEGYKYVTAHGVGPSTLPKDVNVLASETMDNGYVVFWTDRWLDTNELEQYDIKPETNLARYGADKYDLVNGQVIKNGVTMEKLGNDLIAQGYTQDEVKRILASRKAPSRGRTQIKSGAEPTNNSRRAITNANTDGIRAQMAYTLEAVKDFAEKYDDWDGTEAQAIEKVLGAFVSAKSRSDGKIHGNIQAELADWLQGLPMSIAYSNHDILKLGEEWGYLPSVDYNNGKYTAKERKWVENYWNGIANNILKLARKYKVQTPMPAFNSRKHLLKSSTVYSDDNYQVEYYDGKTDRHGNAGYVYCKDNNTYNMMDEEAIESIMDLKDNPDFDFVESLEMIMHPNRSISKVNGQRVNFNSAKKRPIKNNRLIKSGTANYWQDMDEFPIVIYEANEDVESYRAEITEDDWGYDLDDDTLKSELEDMEYGDAISNAQHEIDNYDFKTIKAEIKNGYYMGLQLIFSELDNDGFYWDYTDEDGEWTEEFERDREEDIQKGNELINELVGYGWQKIGVVGRFSNGEAVYTRLDNACGKKKGKKRIKSSNRDDMMSTEDLIGFQDEYSRRSGMEKNRVRDTYGKLTYGEAEDILNGQPDYSDDLGKMYVAPKEDLSDVEGFDEQDKWNKKHGIYDSAKRRPIKSGMTQKQAERDFIETSSKWNDYYEMQESWSAYVDGLCSDGVISEKQRNSWGNPTTPQRFKSWNDRNYGSDSDEDFE